jgi:hypothetical protein
MTREDYARDYATGHAKTGRPVIVPNDVMRLSEHEPCFLCGQARGCKHRGAS